MSAPPSRSLPLTLVECLLRACDEGDISAVRQAVNCGADVNGKILYELKVTQLIVTEIGPPPHSTEKIFEEDYTPLYIACRRGHTEVAKLLISHGALVEDHFLNVACNAGYADMVALLLDSGADVHFVGEDGKSPLIQAVGPYLTDATLDIITQLHRAGANINQLFGVNDDYFATALAVSCTVGNMPMVSHLISLGADIQNNIAMGSSTTPLYAAASNGYADIVSLLLAAGADCDEIIPSGANPLIIACAEGYSAVVSLLLCAGASVNKQSTCTGSTPLHCACLNNHVDIAIELLIAGASMDIKDKQGRTPLDVAGTEKTRAAVYSSAAVYDMMKWCALPSCHRTLIKGNRQRCSRCKVAYYCGKICSVQHWKEHRKVCKMSE